MTLKPKKSQSIDKKSTMVQQSL